MNKKSYKKQSKKSYKKQSKKSYKKQSKKSYKKQSKKSYKKKICGGVDIQKIIILKNSLNNVINNIKFKILNDRLYDDNDVNLMINMLYFSVLKNIDKFIYEQSIKNEQDIETYIQYIQNCMVYSISIFMNNNRGLYYIIRDMLLSQKIVIMNFNIIFNLNEFAYNLYYDSILKVHHKNIDDELIPVYNTTYNYTYCNISTIYFNTITLKYKKDINELIYSDRQKCFFDSILYLLHTTKINTINDNVFVLITYNLKYIFDFTSNNDLFHEHLMELIESALNGNTDDDKVIFVESYQNYNEIPSTHGPYSKYNKRFDNWIV
jgi:hypothetical protein